MTQEAESATVVTSILGYNENCGAVGLRGTAGTRRAQPPFREGIEWTRDGTNSAFDTLIGDSLWPDRTPFSLLAPLIFKNAFGAGHNNHPVMSYKSPGSTLSLSTVESRLSSPLVPSLI